MAIVKGVTPPNLLRFVVALAAVGLLAALAALSSGPVQAQTVSSPAI